MPSQGLHNFRLHVSPTVSSKSNLDLAMPRRRLNDRLLLWSVSGLALLGVGVHLLHAVQFERLARTLFIQAEDAEKAGELDGAIARLSRYLQFAPDDAGATARYAELLDRAADSPANR